MQELAASGGVEAPADAAMGDAVPPVESAVVAEAPAAPAPAPVKKGRKAAKSS